MTVINCKTKTRFTTEVGVRINAQMLKSLMGDDAGELADLLVDLTDDTTEIDGVEVSCVADQAKLYAVKRPAYGDTITITGRELMMVFSKTANSALSNYTHQCGDLVVDNGAYVTVAGVEVINTGKPLAITPRIGELYHKLNPSVTGAVYRILD